MFNMARNIKEECLIAFIHSRITGLATNGTDGVSVFEESKKQYVDNEGVNIANKLSEISTIDKVNKKIEQSKSIIIANQYHDNYSKLSAIFNSLIPRDAKMIEAVVGLSLLACFIEDDRKSMKLGISTEYITKLITEYEQISKEHKQCALNMMKVATKIFTKYFNRK